MICSHGIILKRYLNIDYLYSFKTYDGNEALFGILGCTNRIEIESKAV